MSSKCHKNVINIEVCLNKFRNHLNEKNHEKKLLVLRVAGSIGTNANSASVEVEVEAELGKNSHVLNQNTLDFFGHSVIPLPSSGSVCKKIEFSIALV